VSPSAREVALEVIRRVTDEGAYSNRVLPAALGRSGLDERDRALATELAYGTIRHTPGLDDAIGARAARPVDRMTPGARTPGSPRTRRWGRPSGSSCRGSGGS
jgi:16S rRNA (cytosine967-C5)-methyltransferase